MFESNIIFIFESNMKIYFDKLSTGLKSKFKKHGRGLYFPLKNIPLYSVYLGIGS